MGKKEVKIIVATHKKYRMPNEKIYIPVHVGKKNKEDIGYIGDDTGDNISEKNPYYCELTGLYWAWKNIKADYIGLVHYRRGLTYKRKINLKKRDKFECVLKDEEIQEIISDVDVILPQKRRYFIETIYSHYVHTLHGETLDETRRIIEDKYLDYLESFDKVMNRTSAHMFNIFIMKKSLLNQYCTWLFSILEELEKRIDPSQYDTFHARYLGRISEILLDVWINKNDIKYQEVPVLNLERTKWAKKIYAFISAKITNKKYSGSF